ncbi:MAG: O-antigen ligase domain-containing protein [Flavobacteriales bacterium TMED191]|nr:MAG: O-antigen ligase domain-containing protein [Flavobacteriales bacterium TMED191]
MNIYFKKININNYLLLLLSVFVSVSIYISDVIIILLCIAWISSGDLKAKLLKFTKTPILWSTILFFLYFLTSYIWSESSIWNITTQKQALILLLPILHTLKFDESYITKAKYGFLIGLFFNILLSLFTFIYPKNSFFKKGHYDDNLFAHSFIDHFDYSIFLCFGIILILSLIQRNKNKYYLIIMIIFIIALLNSYGRIGIVSLLIFFPISILLLSKSKFNFILLFITLIVLLLSFYVFSPFKNRIIDTFNNIESIYSPPSLEQKIESDAIYLSKQEGLPKEFYINQIKHNSEWMEYINSKQPQYQTSIGQRYIYIKNSILLAKKKPLLGFGSNQFKQIYQLNFDDKTIKHPHNNWMFIIIELGVIGLFLAIMIFWHHITQYFKSKNQSFLKFIFPLFFILIMCTDNYFLNHNTLTFFCLFSFLIYNNCTNYKLA